MGSRNHPLGDPLDAEGMSKHLRDKIAAAVTEVDASVLNKIRGLEAMATSAERLARELREGNHDAVIAKAARAAVTAVDLAHTAADEFQACVADAQVLGRQPYDRITIKATVDSLLKIRDTLAEMALLFESRVTDVVEQVGALEPQVPETVPSIMEPEPEPPEQDLPF